MPQLQLQWRDIKKNFGIKIIESELTEMEEGEQKYSNLDFTGSVNATATRYYMGDTNKSKLDINLKKNL